VPALNFGMMGDSSQQNLSQGTGVNIEQSGDPLNEAAIYPNEDESQQSKNHSSNPDIFKAGNELNIPTGGPTSGLGLNMGALANNRGDYQDEFMGKIDEFSESWRQ